MKGWLLFSHALRMVAKNASIAARLSVLPYLLGAVGTFLLMGGFFHDQVAMVFAPGARSVPTLNFAASVLLVTVTRAWIAVGWHRFALLGQAPVSLLPANGGRILAYLGAGVALTFCLVWGLWLWLGLMFWLAVFFIHLKLQGAGFAIMIVGLYFCILPFLIIVLRFSAILPGFALRPGHKVFAGWSATRGATGALALLAILCTGPMGGFAYLAGQPLDGFPLAQAVVQHLVQWPMTLLMISVLTTLYAHYIEGRPLG